MRLNIETERLLLRAFSIDDAEGFYHLNNITEVIQFTGDKPFIDVGDAKHFLENYTGYNTNGYGRLAVILKATNEFIGWCGIKLNEEKLTDIGFRFLKHHWNKGYATESAYAVLEYAFKDLELEEIIGRVASENIASHKVLEKLKMKKWKTGECEGISGAHYYKITKNEFLDRS